ncbi:MAG: P83/100 family protein [Spirochaetales bacterium]
MRRSLLLLLLIISIGLTAQEVDEDELQELGTQDIDFINYQGPYDRIDSIDEIRSIGAGLGRSVRQGNGEFALDGRYRVVHAVDPEDDVDLLEADIIMPLADARVDHIDNLRRIISGFLVAAYDYGQSDADLIARWTTIYNAVSRGNMEFFQSRYKSVVIENLTPSTAGLSRRWDEWPGQSRIVIPLSRDADTGVLGSVDPGELGDEQVVEELRSQDDRGIEERQQMTDLQERVIDEQEEAQEAEEEAIEEEADRLAQEERDIAEEEEALREEREAAQELPEEEREQAERELDERERENQERAQRAEEDQEALEERREELARDRQETAELTEQVRAERERISRDARALLDERELSDEVRGLEGDLAPVYFVQVREEGPLVLGQLVQINPVTGVLINRSRTDQIVSRRYLFAEDDLLVVVTDGDEGALVRLDVSTLEENLRGADVVFPGTVLELRQDPDRIYAVVEDAGEWYVGRFRTDLSLIDRSVIAVNPYTTLAFGGGKLFVQTADNRIVGLSLEDLRISP